MQKHVIMELDQAYTFDNQKGLFISCFQQKKSITFF